MYLSLQLYFVSKHNKTLWSNYDMLFKNSYILVDFTEWFLFLDN